MKAEPRQVPKERPGPIGGKRDRNRRKRTRTLLEAGQSLFLEKGIEVVTIDEIVNRAEVSKGSFYRYFHDKTDLVDALLAAVRERIDEALDTCADMLAAARTPEELAMAYVVLGSDLTELFVENEGTVQLYLQESRVPGVGARKPIRRMAEELTRRAIELAEIADRHSMMRPLSPQVSALSVVGAVERLLYAHFQGELKGDPAAIVQDLITLVLDGVRLAS